eukprot:453363_1
MSGSSIDTSDSFAKKHLSGRRLSFRSMARDGAPFLLHDTDDSGNVCKMVKVRLELTDPGRPLITCGPEYTINLHDVTAVLGGKRSEILQALSDDDVPSKLCLVIESRRTTLNLQAVSPAIRDEWIDELDNLIEEISEDIEAVARPRIDKSDG